MASGLSHQIRCPVCWNDLKDPVCLPYQKPICVVCKEEETHRGHTFKTLNDAFHCKKQKTSEALETLLSVEGTLIGLVNDQAEEILKTMGKSKTLSDHISDQFLKLRKFLDDKERELKKKLEEEENQILGIMGVNMCTMEEMLSDVGTKQVIVKSALEMKQPSQFLQWWNENGRFVNREIFLFKTDPTLQDVSVIPDTLSLGIYETYLQFFVWKEMLRYIQSVPHHHTVEDKGDQGISISPSGRSIQPKKVGKSQKNKPSSLWLKAESSFYEGKHFWELDVGKNWTGV
ncbi:hypothetical protein HF521_017474 [Silurus meridionalis]|uniref:B box-type domain-containing protein n=1 Tax=Silurus meridionalis TaxID=175797 RepID=A0A8T0BS62_SILME|nr:hypothetical protein HF521_017474 [Silurus meridionalis]